MKSNKTNNTVVFEADEYEELLEELNACHDYRQKTGREMAYIFHFLRYYNLNKLFEAFKENPPADDEDDVPFSSYRSYR